MIRLLLELGTNRPKLVIGIGAAALFAAPLTWVGLSIPAFVSGDLTLFEINALTAMLFQMVVIAVLGFGSLWFSAQSLNRQTAALEEAHRPVIDVRLKPYDRERSDERSVRHELSIQNFGAGAALDTWVISLIAGEFFQRLGGQSVAAGDSAEVLEASSQATEPRDRIWGKPFELVAVYRDVLGNWWWSSRSYAAYPAGVAALQVRQLTADDRTFLTSGGTGAWTVDETPPF